MHIKTIAVVILLGSSSLAVMAENQRHHEAHEHGAGQLNIAIDHTNLMIELSAPAMNIVGFEHAPNEKEDKDRVNHALNSLKDGLKLFAPSTAAECSLISVKVATSLVATENHHENNHDDQHDAEDHDEETHADFDATYTFSCEQPDKLESLTLALFSVFPGTHHLTTQVISNSGQLGAKLEAKNPVLKLK